MSPAAAARPVRATTIGIGNCTWRLHGAPVAGQVPVPGTAAVILGWTDHGSPIVLSTTSLEILDDLESAIQVERAQAIVEAGMTVTR